MPVRPPAQCRRPVSQTSLASQMAIWITDPMLRQAIDQYNRRFTVPCRRLSSHKGPLESRRRLGKRQMTGVIPTSIHNPLWHFEVASIPGDWKWEPPTTQEERNRRTHNLSISGIFDNFIGWLEKSDASKPFLQPPLVNGSISPATALEGVAFDATREATSEIMMPTQVNSILMNIPTEIRTIRAKIALLEEVNEDALNALIKNCRRSIRRRMGLGYFTAEKILHAFDPFDAETMNKIGDPQMAEKFTNMIRRSILSQLDIAQQKSNAVPLDDLWIAVAGKILSTPATYHNIRLFWRLMWVIPEELKAQLSSDQISYLTRSYIDIQANSRNTLSRWSARAAWFAVGLQRLTASQRKSLEHDIGMYLLEGRTPETSRKMQFAWLLAKSYDESLGNKEFLAYYQNFTQNYGWHANSLQLWQLMLGRLKATKAIDVDAYSSLVKANYRTFTQRWSCLLLSLQASPTDTALKELCDTLKGAREMDRVVATLATRPITPSSIAAAQVMATACDDHRLALQLHAALEAQVGQGRRLAGWNWSAWEHYVKRIIQDPEIVQPVLWHVLDLTSNAQTETDGSPSSTQEIKAKLRLLDQMCHWYITEATHLNERQVLRRIERCILAQRAIAQTISPQTLAHLVDFITGDLAKGQWGRTTRLEWLVKLISQTQGEEQAGGALEALRGWRWMVDQKSRGNSSW